MTARRKSGTRSWNTFGLPDASQPRRCWVWQTASRCFIRLAGHRTQSHPCRTDTDSGIADLPVAEGVAGQHYAVYIALEIRRDPVAVEHEATLHDTAELNKGGRHNAREVGVILHRHLLAYGCHFHNLSGFLVMVRFWRICLIVRAVVCRQAVDAAA